MELAINNLTILSWFIMIFFLFKKYGYKENVLSPLNLYILLNLFGIIISLFVEFGSSEVLKEILPSYFSSENLDLTFYSLNNILYAILSFFLYMFLLVFKYKPLASTKIDLSKIKLNKYDIFYLLVSAFISFYLIKTFYGNPFNLNTYKMVEFRYTMSHGIYALFGVLLATPVFFVLLVLLFHPLLKFRNKIIIFIFTIFMFYYGILQNARGFFVFPILMNIFFLLNISYSNVMYLLMKLKLKRSAFILILLMGGIIWFYSWYSYNFRGQSGNLWSFLQRFDNFYASYLVLENSLYGFRLENFIYPFSSFIPRFLFVSKLFPVNAQITWHIFGFDESWSINFGAVGEALFTSYGIILPISSLLIALFIKGFRLLYNKSTLDIFDLQIMFAIYTMPFSICMGGILTPSVSNFFLFMAFMFVNKFLRRIKI